ncbi:hypothetical protein [Aerococcus suis]|uniref:Amino acid metabolism n=1 Tax=Aerococcus suis TaxID=371602 RepID=A0A1W1Y5R5_9LACT|nr:hypothetical protein [Aerococcus suis]MCI7240901.1 DUF1831 domain-containing protein [Aerococcus suis]MDD7758352.1 hypothetical protein [Aerococcus suis]MDY4646946.1 hypothetical protein [Aerococcus suis]SMC31550.1 Putative amino acid metabolism [Aerococcus suis]
MALKEKATFPGSNNEFSLHPDCKKYTLRDYGFQQTPKGQFEYNRPVKPSFKDSRSIMLKIQVAKDLSGLSMNTTNANGLQSVNVYKGDRLADFIQPLEAILTDMEEQHVLKKH